MGSLIEKRGESFVINYPNINQISVFSSLFGEWCCGAGGEMRELMGPFSLNVNMLLVALENNIQFDFSV